MAVEVTTRKVATALREACDWIALTRGISTVRAGAVVRKSHNGVRVYYAALVSSPATVDRMLREYTATLRGAGFKVYVPKSSIFIDVIGKEA